MSEATIKQRCNELKRRIEFLKEECGTLFVNLSVSIYKNELDNCYLCIGSLKNNFTNSYNIVEEILETVTSHINQLEYRVDHLVRLSNKLTLTERQDKCLKELGSLLEGVGMSLNDMELLCQVKVQSNIKFHSNDQSLDQVKLSLHIPIPDEMNQYKPSLQKALEAIDKWSPGRTTHDAIYFSNQK
ncbi:hypothetical protein C1646_770688 [Rhizophagus diaphanus]|nr:hypothetical protein C1646_770688 [Rhizophagus diaphanus] [Rhizophagus sp. MUCL 43196]